MNYLVKCKFCPKTNIISGGAINEYRGGLVPKKSPSNLYWCPSCESNFFYEGERLIGYSFKSQYKGSPLLVYWFEENGYTEIHKNHKLVTKINGGTSLNPHNIAEKMPLILTFL